MKKIVILGTIIMTLATAFYLFQKSNITRNTDIDKEVLAKSEKVDYYSKQFTIDDLQLSLQDNKDMTVYFYKPNCPYCENVSPIIVPMAEKLNVDMKVLNLEKYPIGWDQFKVEGTPTLIHYKGGKEVSRIEGADEEENYKTWFREINMVK